MNQFDDIYFEKEYAKLYEKMENGEIHEFKIENEDGKITNLFIKREIPIDIDGKKYYDLVTPYGYGGPRIHYSSNKEKLLEEYEKEFQKYCMENNIVSEFIRFHPIMENALDFEKIYNSTYMRKTLVTNLKDYEDPVQTQFSKNCKRDIKQILKKGVEYKINEAPEKIGAFKEIYYSTMNRNNATDFYYFDDEYFEKLLKNFRQNIILVEAVFEGKVIAVDFYFIYNKTIHFHLSGTFSEYLHLSPTSVLKYAIVNWGKEKGYNLIHLGGGRSNSEDDSLYVFKKKFAQTDRADFYIGKRVWNQDIYNKMCEIKNVNPNDEFFPAYRKV